MQLLKLALELGPLAVFFIANNKFDLFVATAVFMVATVVSLIASRLLLKKIPIMPLVTGAFVLVFGGLTLWLHDETFIKMKPTIVNLLFAGFLFGGLLLKRPVLQYILGEAMRLTDVGWRKLSLRWAFFFLAMAALNEIVWRNFSEGTWASFKVFGILPLTLGFAVLQLGLMRRYEGAPASHPGSSPRT
jgi:intracellular septation protein